jgi:membrane-bound serine protease (ClpP class)
MSGPVQLFFILLVSGLILIGAEIFLPGAVLGFLGGLVLLGAVIAGYQAFPGYGTYIAAGIVVLVAVAIWLWIRFFPNSRMGRKLTVSQDLAHAKAANAELKDLVGKEGEARSELRPGGIVTIDGRRVDVVTEGGMIAKGTRVRVVAVEASRVVVRKV